MREKPSSFAFSAKDREILDLMNSLGMSRNLSKVVVFLSKVGEASSRDIEMAIDMRQSEVSIAANRLRDNGWVTARSLKKPSKGRPNQIYKLRFSLRRTIKDFESRKVAEMEELKKKFVRLKRLAK